MLALRDIMTPDVISVGPDTPLGEVAELLAAEGISGVPVVGTSRVLGVVSASDIMDFSATDAGESRELGGGPVWDAIEESGGEVPLAPFYYDPWLDRQVVRGEPEWDAEDEPPFGEFTASDVMTRGICALPSSTPLDDAGRYMLERGIHRVLVIDDGTLVGIVTSMDFVRVVAERAVVNA
jgi:CBS domain-containing protein